MMVADATLEKGGIASSGGRRFAPSRRRRCRYAQFHHVMWRHLVEYLPARVRCAYPRSDHATHVATPPLGASIVQQPTCAAATLKSYRWIGVLCLLRA